MYVLYLMSGALVQIVLQERILYPTWCISVQGNQGVLRTFARLMEVLEDGIEILPMDCAVMHSNVTYAHVVGLAKYVKPYLRSKAHIW